MDRLKSEDTGAVTESVMMTIDDVATVTRLGKRTIQRMVLMGEFPKPLDMGCRRRFWHRDRVMGWLTELDRQAQGDN